MCFSAPASFIASGGLVTLGAASLAVAKKEDKVLAAIPLLFGIQQALEGIQWLYLGAGSSSLAAGYGFLIFAFIIWPFYTPLTVFLLDNKARSTLRWFVLLGIAVAVYFVYDFIHVFMTQSLYVSKLGACVSYSFDSPLGAFATIPYLLVLFAPLLISSRRIFRWFGLLVAMLATVAWYFYAEVFTSVWCFFAAAVSSLFFFYLLVKRRKKNNLRDSI